MAKKSNQSKSSSEVKSLRLQRIIFIAFSVIIVLTMVLGLMSQY